MRFISSNLTRRIIFSNLIGLGILLGGYFYLVQEEVWLIDAKRDSLRAQGEIMAAAIAADASADTDSIRLDPDKLPEPGGALIPFRDDGFAALELSIRPEQVTPVLRRLLQNTTIRARVYGRDGTLISDSDRVLSRGQVSRADKTGSDSERPRTKNLLTRMTEFFSSSKLAVYKEIGGANGMLYPEVRDAMVGKPRDLRLITELGEQIVSFAAPVRRFGQVQGVLLLSTKPGDIDQVLKAERWAIVRVALLALAATIAASLLLAKTVAGPMHHLSEAAKQVSHSINARQQLPDFSNRKDEIGQLATAFSSMTNALYRRIEASEKFAADVAHELKNPLTAARSTAESLTYAKTEEQRDQLVQQIQNELKRLNRLITDVSNASRLDAELALREWKPVDLIEVLSGIVNTFRDILDDDGRRIEFVVEPSAVADAYIVIGHEERLAQVVTNLMDNALSFSPAQGLVTLKVRRDGELGRVLDRGRGTRHRYRQARDRVRAVLYLPADRQRQPRQQLRPRSVDLARNRGRARRADLGREPARTGCPRDGKAARRALRHTHPRARAVGGTTQHGKPHLAWLSTCTGRQSRAGGMPR